MPNDETLDEIDARVNAYWRQQLEKVGAKVGGRVLMARLNPPKGTYLKYVGKYGTITSINWNEGEAWIEVDQAGGAWFRAGEWIRAAP